MGKQWKQWLTLFLGGSKITADGDCSHEIKRCLLLGRKVMTNLDSILKSRDITLPTKVCLVKAMVFPVVMYGCESSTADRAGRHAGRRRRAQEKMLKPGFQMVAGAEVVVAMAHEARGAQVGQRPLQAPGLVVQAEVQAAHPRRQQGFRQVRGEAGGTGAKRVELPGQRGLAQAPGGVFAAGPGEVPQRRLVPPGQRRRQQAAAEGPEGGPVRQEGLLVGRAFIPLHETQAQAALQ